ncbi:fucolectin-like [Discoglossus pictus]
MDPLSNILNLELSRPTSQYLVLTLRMKCFGILFFVLGLSNGWAQSPSCVPPESGKNLAKGGKACQSSLYGSNLIPHAGRAIDGDTEGNFMKGSCTHTNNDKNPWWRVDLKESYSIGVVVISNRKDCCEDRLLGAEIRAGGSANNNNPVCGVVTDVSSPTITICCNGLPGRYVSVVIPGASQYLTLCEVSVYEHLEPEMEQECAL